QLTGRDKALIVGFLLGFLAVVAGGGYWLYRPARSTADPIADAQTYVNARKSPILAATSKQLQADPHSQPFPPQQHPLLGQPAPDFQLLDHQGKPHRLHDALRRGPAVVVFYYGAHCDHCVAQLFALQEDWRFFDELGAQVLVLSPDSPAETAEQ